uniref:Uncharacterized protein n=1 Tax=Zea mays TaxID=4577 RepID=A0A804PZP8_MAIZE
MAINKLVPRVRHTGEAPVDAVRELPRVRLLLRRQELPLPQRVHGGVRVLADLRQRSYVDEVHGYLLHRPRHALGGREEVPVRAHLQFLIVADRRLCLGEAFYGVGAAPTFAPGVDQSQTVNVPPVVRHSDPASPEH